LFLSGVSLQPIECSKCICTNSSTTYRVFQMYLYQFINCYEPKRTPRQIKRPSFYT